MPPLTDPNILAQFRAVLAEWAVTGYITARDVPLEWIATNLGGMTLKDVARAMHIHLQAGGVIDQVPERRPEWNMWPFHYDFRLHLGTRFVYIETILQDDDPRDPTIQIVSVRDV
jgi:hypothetical protein